MAGTLDFETWASLSARLRAVNAPEQEAILKAAKIEASAWNESNAYWRRQLQNDLAASNLDRPEAYAQACVAERKRRLKEVAAASQPIPSTPREAAPPSSPGGAEQAPIWGEAPPKVERSVPTYARARVPEPPSSESTLLPLGPDVRSRTLPFVEGPSTPRAIPVPPRSSDGETIASATPLTDAPLPFVPDTPGVELTLEQYAAMRAQLEVSPERSDEIMARYRIRDAKARRVLDEVWRKRFAADPSLQLRFLQLGLHYGDHFASSKEKT